LPLKTIVAGSKKFPIEAYIEEEFSDSEDEINEPGYVTDGSGAGDEPGHQEKDFKSKKRYHAKFFLRQILRTVVTNIFVWM